MHKIIEMTFNEDDLESGVHAISIVESPAIESDFITLNSEDIKLKKVDEEKHILMGAALIPDKLIFRNSDEGGHYIFFAKDTIRKISEMYLKQGNQKEATLEHDVKLEGLTIVESWIVEDEFKDKSRLYDINAPLGTWVVSMKVDNMDLWEEFVKTGKVKGFSIEGKFKSSAELTKELTEDEVKIEKIRALVEEYIDSTN